ncbi:MAG: cytochrome c biogenesis protein CcsA, partial [Deltaproteobacteria bacterium]|nr:cytochrome c biogenesis protein CcsA [Deltaproteobacteria bacterium]
MAGTMQKRGRARRVTGILALAFILVGLYFALIEAPPDAYQGEVQRIMYVHIPSILTAYLSFFIVFIGSCLFLWKREKRDDILARSAAEIGVLFTGLTIIEGSYLMLRSLIEDENRGAVCSAVVGVIGFLDIPLIHMSVYWWRTLHQPPSILRPDKMPWENVHPSMLIALAVNFAAFILLYFYLLSLRFRVGEMEE